ncbi:2-succinyl-5-enolpyruvyl-6-hydroxy-3-cyclohexene-1-carboxylate synthase [uncultured Adlercreutzia sp.]|uniref:2-succinyl-5-enolpyruvyl-6-hydroxy-3- cyclohexene-1-carboxylate synthase n=1 Tax=uncultured Adlercreutzia sp. TaxID=875803 RepID=UPI0025D313B7|nr:thiamine pyrophosphate-binding protein [uncultured Adlercreutzia sp.]MCI9261560.1 2-succinyl-5-enolpyruvyl-6-hydroxy-3-cyclohexene-1-carboxylic-acid synthase [Eggerthellaceae bacterium]
MITTSHQQDTALFVAAFFDELTRWGVREVVVSPGSRSTALAMTAFELSQRRPDDLRLYVDVDERGASFLALGLAKASGSPVALVCTSGTALANYYPAVIEAETSRVPLIVLSGDRPPQLQGLGAPQTTDQLKAYGDHVRAFRAMPTPRGRDRDIAFARQAAREACLAALGPTATLEEVSCVAGGADMPVNYNPEAQVASRACQHLAGPVHLNFPFDAPLKPDFLGADNQAALRGGIDCFGLGRRVPTEGRHGAPLSIAPLMAASGELPASSVTALEELLWKRPAVLLAGEGSCETMAEAEEIVTWVRRWSIPVLADPLSGLRSIDDPLVIDNYDNLCGRPDCPVPEVVIRFGRYPISKRATTLLERARPLSIAVDVAETRDFNATTDVFVGTTPLGFVRSNWHGEGRKAQKAFAERWMTLNDEARLRILAVEWDGVTSLDAEAVEGAYVRSLLELMPDESCLFSANSMSIRALDTFYLKDGKTRAVLANRGQNGIDGVVSTAVGAAQHFGQTTFLTGDFTLLHDLNGLALQREMMLAHPEGEAPSLVIVLLNNNGGAIFDMLPQASEDPYFERLFLAPQDVRFTEAAAAFGIPSATVHTVGAFRSAYQNFLGTPGISLVEVQLPLRGVRDRYAPYQG